MIELYAELEDYILRDIVRRIMKAGRITATADRMIWLLRQMGEQQNEIQKKLAEMMGITQAELRRLLQGAVMTSWQDDLGTLSMITNTPVSSPLENPRVMSVMDAEYRKSLGELRNLTRTTMTAANSDLARLLDEAEMRVASGAQSYSQAIIDVLDNYAGEGLKVTYPSGRRISLEAAVRMCVVTSMNQTAAQVTNQYIVEAGTNYVLVSAHIGARVRTEKQPPCAGHDEWQGKVYCIRGSEEGFPNLLEATGYDIDPVTGMGTVVNPLGLHGYNCRHGHRPFAKDLRNPYQNADGSQKIDTKENERMFDLLQRQRAMERAIRRTKRELLVKQNEVDLEPDADRKAALQRQADDIQARLWKQNRAYNDFCRRNGLATQYDRTHLANIDNSEFKKRQPQFGAASKHAIVNIGDEFVHESKTLAYNPEADFDIQIPGLSDNVNQIISSVARGVAELGGKDRLEHMRLVDLDDGDFTHHEDGEPESVGVDFWTYAEEHSDRRFAFVHNHNEVSSLSLTDLTTPVLMKNIPIMIAVQNDGVIYFAIRAKDSVSNFFPDEYYDNSLLSLRKMARDGIITPAQRTMMREEILCKETINEFYGGKVWKIDARNK